MSKAFRSGKVEDSKPAMHARRVLNFFARCRLDAGRWGYSLSPRKRGSPDGLQTVRAEPGRGGEPPTGRKRASRGGVLFFSVRWRESAPTNGHRVRWWEHPGNGPGPPSSCPLGGLASRHVRRDGAVVISHCPPGMSRVPSRRLSAVRRASTLRV